MADKFLQQVWLLGLAKLVKSELITDYRLDTVVSFGFPMGRAIVDNVRGVCYKAKEDGQKDIIFIHPAEWEKPENVIRTFLHEAIHSVLDANEDHGPAFRQRCANIGLQGDLADTPDDGLKDWIDKAVALLPKMPDDVLARDPRFVAPKTTKGRMVGYTCSCGWKVYCTKKDALLATCGRCNSAFERNGKAEP